MAVDLKSLGKVELAALGLGGLSILLSFFGSYVRASVDGGGLFEGVSAGSNAWTSYATLGMLLIVAGTAVVAVRAFAAETLPAGVPWNLVALATSALGTLLIVLRAVTASDSGFGVSVGPGWSGYALFVTTIGLTACTALLFKSSGEKIPGVKTATPPPAA